MSSGRLLGFVNRSGRYESPYNSDRNAAQALKFSQKPTAITSGVGVAAQKELGSGYIDQNNNRALSPLPILQKDLEAQDEHQLQNNYNENAYPQSIVFDSIVDSDFDHTRTDSLGEPETNFQPDDKDNQINFMLGRKYVDSNFEQSYRPSNGALQQLPGITNQGPSNDMRPFHTTKTGRFQLVEPKNQIGTSNFADNNNLNKFASAKQSHSEDGFSDIDQGELNGNEGSCFGEMALNTTPNRHQKNLRVGDLNLYGSHLENDKVKNNIFSSFTADYDDENLKKMTYCDLDAQPWEEIPSKKTFAYPRELRVSGINLEAKINFYLAGAHKEKSNVDGPGRKAALAFYEQLSSKEWDEAGEIFIHKFTELMQRLQDKRREKRELAQRFESMIKSRERAIRKKTSVIEKKLQDMRAGGENLLVGSPRSMR